MSDVFEKEKLNRFSKVNKVIGIMSGKGGVGKSTVSSLVASSLNAMGYKVGVMDADITGPSIPRLFGVANQRAQGCEFGIEPIESVTGIKLMSMNLLMEDENAPVIWRGPIVAQTVKQFYNEVYWGELDYMVIDLPPGTGDVPLTIMQSIPLDGVIVVSTPQSVVNMVVQKSIHMANKLNIPIIGVIENMSYLQCTHCDEKLNVFGESHIADILIEQKVPLIHRVPIDPEISALANEGKMELYEKLNFNFAEVFSKELKEALIEADKNKMFIL